MDLSIIAEPVVSSIPEIGIEMACLARIQGEAMTSFPKDLYIPPDALEVILEVFEGPLDLLLYLIQKHNLDILNIPVAEMTRQYMAYVDLMTIFQLELVADYLEMAALLTEIKSRMLLPRPPEVENLEADPRAELVRRLQEYERFKTAAMNFEMMPREGRDFYLTPSSPPPLDMLKALPEINLNELLTAFRDILKRVDLQSMHMVQREPLSVRERMSSILSQLSTDSFANLVGFFVFDEGRLGIVVTFLAILELAKEAMIELTQAESFGPIYIRAIA